MRLSLLIPALIGLLCAAEPAANLVPNPEFRTTGGGSPEGWTAWTPIPSLAPVSEVAREPGGNALRLHSRGFASFGKWVSAPIAVQPGRYYRFDVLYKPQGVADETGSVSAMLSWNAGSQPVQRDYVDRISPEQGGWRRAARAFRAPEKAGSVTVELWLRCSEAGSVSFRSPRLAEAPEPAKRTIRVVTTRIPPQDNATMETNLKYMAATLDRAAKEKPDVILLTENFVNRGIPGPQHASAQPVPGPATEVMGAKARQYKSYIVTSLVESDGGRNYITAVLIDREGRLAGKYRKTHLPLAEAEDGITPGKDYPVFDTDFGRVGLLVCWDNSFPEVARILALKGAEILFLPIAGDTPKHWDAVSRARAVENGVYLAAASSNSCSSRILNPEGDVLAETLDGVAAAEIDLGKEYRTYWLSVGPADGEGKSLYLKERRPETYSPLVTAAP